MKAATLQELAALIAAWREIDAPIQAEQDAHLAARLAKEAAKEEVERAHRLHWWATHPVLPPDRVIGCTCDDSLPLHPCPYESDVSDNKADFCGCCPVCVARCAEEI